MKSFCKIITIFASVILIAAFSFGVFADIDGMDEDIVGVLDSQLTEQELSVLTDESNYYYSLSGASFDGAPMLRVYNSVFWEYSHKPLDELLAEAERVESARDYSFYAVFDGDPIKICVSKKDDGTVMIYKAAVLTDDIATFFTDIADLSGVTELGGVSCTMQNIYCFDSTHSYLGATVYLKTDKGVFVKYYDDERSQGVLFTESEFRKYAEEYHAYLISYEHNYDEDGNPLVGNPSFCEFLESRAGAQTPKTGSGSLFIFAALMICAAALVFFPGVYRIIRRS